MTDDRKRNTGGEVELLELVGTLAAMPPHHQEVVKAYASANVERALADTLSTPKLNIRCEHVKDGITGTTTLPVIRVEEEDDGSFTAVTNYWPQDDKEPAPRAIAAKRSRLE